MARNMECKILNDPVCVTSYHAPCIEVEIHFKLNFHSLTAFYAISVSCLDISLEELKSAAT